MDKVPEMQVSIPPGCSVVKPHGYTQFDLSLATRAQWLRILRGEFNDLYVFYLPAEFKADPEFVDIVLLQRPKLMRVMNQDTLVALRDSVLFAVCLDECAFEYVPRMLKHDLQFMTRVIRDLRPEQLNTAMMTFAPVVLHHPALMMTVLKKCGNEPGCNMNPALFRIPEDLMSQMEFAEAGLAISSCFSIIGHLRADERLFRIAIARDPIQYIYAPENLRFVKEPAYEAVAHFGGLYEFVGQELQNDEALLRVAFETSPHMLSKAPDRFKADQQVVLASVIQDGDNLRHAAPALHENALLLIVAVATAGHDIRLRMPNVTVPVFQECLTPFVRQIEEFHFVFHKPWMVGDCDEKRARRYKEAAAISKLNEHGTCFLTQFKKRIIQYWIGNFDLFVAEAKKAPFVSTERYIRPLLPYSL